MSDESRFSEASGRPYESNARKNAQSRGVVKAMDDPVLGRNQPQWTGLGVSEAFI